MIMMLVLKDHIKLSFVEEQWIPQMTPNIMKKILVMNLKIFIIEGKPFTMKFIAV